MRVVGRGYVDAVHNLEVTLRSKTNGKHHSSLLRLDALALSVIATATWLAGWVAGWLSHSGIVSKPLNLSENFLDHLKDPSL